jgi:hypothetical protein
LSPEVRDALEAAAGVGERKRPMSTETVRQLVYAAVLELPSLMTISELCDELCIGANQGQPRVEDA